MIWRRRSDDDERALADAEARLRAQHSMTPFYERQAEVIAKLPPGELEARLRLAMTTRRAT